MARLSKRATIGPAAALNGHAKGKANGFALNMTSGGADPRDADFERI
jgi:hypothetical protein